MGQYLVTRAIFLDSTAEAAAALEKAVELAPNNYLMGQSRGCVWMGAWIAPQIGRCLSHRDSPGP